MKVKRIIEIEETNRKLLESRNLTLDKNAMLKGTKKDLVTSVAVLDLINALKESKPYDDSGDLISREALKRETEQNYDKFVCLNDYNAFLKLIDNAPKVFDCRSCKNNGNERECVDCHDYCNFVRYEAGPQGEITEEQAINKLHETGWLIGHDKEMTTRPQGEWKLLYKGDKSHSANYECSICQREIYFDAKTESLTDYPFCHCGAKMKGSAENG